MQDLCAATLVLLDLQQVLVSSTWYPAGIRTGGQGILMGLFLSLWLGSVSVESWEGVWAIALST